jgi:hypothetical protein
MRRIASKKHLYSGCLDSGQPPNNKKAVFADGLFNEAGSVIPGVPARFQLMMSSRGLLLTASAAQSPSAYRLLHCQTLGRVSDESDTEWNSPFNKEHERKGPSA